MAGEISGEVSEKVGVSFGEQDIETIIVNTIKVLSIEAIERAKSGHPGAPMGMADYAFVLWSEYLKHYPKDPHWPDRDRFILSAGHASMLLYSLLLLTGYDITVEDIKRFRQWGSRTPGHPEVGHTPGVEVTTGPLGQGFAMGVGMAIAERILSEIFNTPQLKIVDHRTWAIVSDGDIMEGISSEAASIAGHLGLGKLIYFYDYNRVTIDGPIDLAFSEDVKKKFEAMGWHVVEIDGHDRLAIRQAIEESIKCEDKPSLIIGYTSIAKGSPGKEGSHKAHGAPLGQQEVEATKRNIGWRWKKEFYIPDEVKEFFARKLKVWEEKYREWKKNFELWRKDNPDLAKMWDDFFSHKVPEEIVSKFPTYPAGKEIATRAVSGEVLQIVADYVQNLVGGSADLTESVKTFLKKWGIVSRGSWKARNIFFGVREHAMGAISNGIALHGGLRPYCGTFLVFSDYMRPAIRLAALQNTNVIFVFSHDSIFIGEDGPTHQPVEHLASLRAIPNLVVIRPADANEVPWAWYLALKQKRPTAIILTRQPVPTLDRSKLAPAHLVMKGGYKIADCEGEPDILILASGSEVHLAVEAHFKLREMGIKTRVVNLVSWEIFEEQPEDWKNSVIPPFPRVPLRLVVEAGTRLGWEKYAGPFAEFITVERFGVSAPWRTIAEKFGFTVDNVVKKAVELFERKEEILRKLKSQQ